MAEGASTVAEGALAAVEVSRRRGRRDGQAVGQSCGLKVEDKCRGGRGGRGGVDGEERSGCESAQAQRRERVRVRVSWWTVDVQTWHAGLR